MLLWQRAAEAHAGMERDESTVMGCDIEIYQTVDADADRDGPGSNRGRTQTVIQRTQRYGIQLTDDAEPETQIARPRWPTRHSPQPAVSAILAAL